MTSFLGRWPDYTNSDSLLSVTMDGTQLQVIGGLTALGAIGKIEAYNKIKENFLVYYNPENKHYWVI